MKARGIPIRLQWVPGHCNDTGNDVADRLAKEAVSPRKMHPFQPLLSRENGFIRKRVLNEWKEERAKSTKGGHLRRIDKTLSAIRTRRLYGSLPRNRAYLLTQLRTGHYWLATYEKQHGFRDDDRCICGARETVVHVLVDCPRLRDLRRQLRGRSGVHSAILQACWEDNKVRKVRHKMRNKTTAPSGLYWTSQKRPRCFEAARHGGRRTEY